MKLSTFVKAVKEGTKVIVKQQVRAFNELDEYQKTHYIYSAVNGTILFGKAVLGKNKKQAIKDYMEFIATDSIVMVLDGTYEKLLNHGKEHQNENASELANAIEEAFKEEEAKSSKPTQSQ